MIQPEKETVKGKRWLLSAGPVSCVQGSLPRILGTEEGERPDRRGYMEANMSLGTLSLSHTQKGPTMPPWPLPFLVSWLHREEQEQSMRRGHGVGSARSPVLVAFSRRRALSRPYVSDFHLWVWEEES